MNTKSYKYFSQKKTYRSASRVDVASTRAKRKKSTSTFGNLCLGLSARFSERNYCRAIPVIRRTHLTIFRSRARVHYIIAGVALLAMERYTDSRQSDKHTPVRLRCATQRSPRVLLSNFSPLGSTYSIGVSRIRRYAGSFARVYQKSIKRPKTKKRKV